VRLSLPRFTVIGATTRLDLLTGALRSRFGAIFRLDFYDQDAMTLIVKRAAALFNVPIEPDGAYEIASRARGTPRIAIRLLKRVRDYAQVRGDGTITKQIADEALDLLDIDHLGLDDIDRRVLRTIIEKFNGGPVGVDVIAASISEEAGTITDVYEPYLLQLGFLNILPRGRVATRRAYEHLGIPYHGAEEQGQLL
ncbi:MAG: Holliday junction branch migration DNA helicase RuvB, partial [Candidatus Thermofonsia Clade 1 bacterium]